METNMSLKKDYEVLSSMTNGSTTFEVLVWDELKGGSNVNHAMMTFFMKESNLKMKMLRVKLNNSSVKLEAGALYYMQGNVEMTAKLGGVMGLGKKMFGGMATNETAIKPLYQGSGEVFTEPRFGHFALFKLQDEEIIVDDGVFYACEGDVQVGVAAQKNVSSALLGNESLFQTKVKGSGLVALEIPVPESELVKVTLNNDVLKVDGNFAVVRTGDITFTVEKSTKSIIGSAASGEGLLNVYKGTGEVWLAPTLAVYKNLSYGFTPTTGGKMNTKV